METIDLSDELNDMRIQKMRAAKDKHAGSKAKPAKDEKKTLQDVVNDLKKMLASRKD